MAKKRASKKFKKETGLKRLIRYLEKGDKLVIKGVRGKPVKNVRHDGKYILEVKRKGKLIGWVNNAKTVTVKHGKKTTKSKVPTPQAFTKSMMARLQHTVQVKNAVGPKVRGREKVKLVSNRRVTSQITTKSRLIRELKENSGSAFNLRFEFGKDEVINGNRIYYKDGDMSDDELKNLVLSNFFTMLGTRNLRISDRLKTGQDGHVVKSKRRLVEKGEIQLEFSSVNGSQWQCERCKTWNALKLKKCKECRAKRVLQDVEQ
jgi:hypothetical protein